MDVVYGCAYFSDGGPDNFLKDEKIEHTRAYFYSYLLARSGFGNPNEFASRSQDVLARNILGCSDDLMARAEGTIVWMEILDNRGWFRVLFFILSIYFFNVFFRGGEGGAVRSASRRHNYRGGFRVLFG